MYQKLKSTVEREGKKLALRISVESGGCHGYQTKLAIVDPSQAAPED
jgi:Fe-S cluster assembly iron-binding protein IscA